MLVRNLLLGYDFRRLMLSMMSWLVGFFFCPLRWTCTSHIHVIGDFSCGLWEALPFFPFFKVEVGWCVHICNPLSHLALDL